MDLNQILNSLRVVQLPMRTKFRGITSREVALIEGPAGWGEFSPFLEYSDAESANWLKSGIEAATSHDFPKFRDEVKVNGTIPATDSIEEIETLVSLYQGAEVFKVKVGTDLQTDLARLKQVKKLTPKARLRIDVNGSWSVDEALQNIENIYGEIGELEYIEQPVAELDSLKELKERLNVDVKFAGDEVIRKASDPFAITLDGAIDILMLKVAPLGGIKRSLEIAQHHNLPVVVSSALESAIGISHGLRLAAALPKLEYVCGLATGTLFTADVATHEIRDGAISLTSQTPNLEALESFAAPRERLEWWRERIKRCWEVLG
ncbi:MAG: O-succinylbenzoate synthase [Candidatus Nanopelagicaceae bacterium]|nr:O-succinylbenzoate synthase [Candidatus Nanopelagicaceae bacterium]